ncbi:hypothetical protein DFH27DRAFT_340468 [Peziza echinospora]|nr:hypothetical protein DFH27DRAFT_340468 [Peziza echinospora]
MSLKLGIPSASIADTSETPYTVYNILIRLPLREHTIQKRYSEFLTFHKALVANTGATPPVSLPGKSFWPRTVASPSLTEDRRVALEKYLIGILESPDPRWRTTTVWRQFLNLPANWTAGSANSSRTNTGLGSPTGAGGIITIATTGQPVTDAGLWLDVHRELKTLLHDARLFLSKRDQAVSPQEQHESSAGAKRCLVKAGGILTALESGLKTLSEPAGGQGRRVGSSGGGGGELGDGEIRRRRDLLASARKEREGLETLANSLATKRPNAASSSTTATASDKAALFGKPANGNGKANGRRVLGAPLPETDRTRELDNNGVLQLQKQFLKEQDQDLESLLKAVTRQKEIGQAIGQELQIQNEMLESLDQDATRLEGKLSIGNRRINKIS